VSGREFFTARTVAEARAGFRPANRTDIETVPLAEALRRVPAEAVSSPSALPGFTRSTVDGFALRAADTFGASDGLPSYLELLGTVRMGATPDVAVRPGSCVAVPTGAALPDGADAVVMVEYTAETMPGTIEVTRPVAAGAGLVRADEDVVAGGPLVPGGRPLRPAELGLLAAAGVTSVPVHSRPRVAIVSTGDEVVPPDTAGLRPAQVRDATAPALAGLVADAGGVPVYAGIVPDERGALEKTLAGLLDEADVVVVSAGSSVGARDETTGAVSALGTVWAPKQFLPQYVPVDENHPLAPHDCYSLSKGLVEDIAKMFHRRTGMQVVAMRFPWVIRPSELSDAVKNVNAHLAEYAPHFWTYVDVRDAATACRQAIEADNLGYDCFDITAADTIAERPTMDLLAEFAPGVEIREQIAGNNAAYTCRRAAQAFGYAPKWSWRQAV